MKKLVCLVLCVALLCTFLVGCQDDEIGAYLEKYKDKVKDDTIVEMELDLYIIVEEGTTKTATDTVNLMINQYLEKFNTKLDIHYLTADEYEKTATDALAFTEATNEDGTPILNEDGTPVYVSSDDRADIVLVTSKAMFDNLYENRLIANITDFYDPNNSPYRSLNTQISPALLSAVTVHEDAYSQDGVRYLGLNKYSVPNNRIVGTYDIFKLSIEAANYYNISKNTFDSLSADEIIALVDSRAENDSSHANGAYERISGTYTDITNIDQDEYYVKYIVPQLSLEEAYQSVFVIARHEYDIRHTQDWYENTTQQNRVAYTNYYDRCMQVVYEINNSVELRNLLQYGKMNTNYKFDLQTDTIYYDKTIQADDYYRMNINYTGDIFKAYYSENLNWNADIALDGQVQNKDAVFSPTDRVEYEMDIYTLGVENNTAVSGTNLILATAGKYYTEVKVTYTVDGAEHTGATLKLVPAEGASEVVIVVTFTCTEGGIVVAKSLTYTIAVSAE